MAWLQALWERFKAWQDYRASLIQVCVDPVRELICHYFTPEEYDEFLRTERRFRERIQRERCKQQLGPECV